MFELVFPIFCFGIVITGVVVKGLFTAAEMNRAQLEHPLNPDEERILETVTSFTGRFSAGETASR